MRPETPLPTMLNVELDETIECYNPACRAELEAPGKDARYCPECGAAQVFECEACPTRPGALVRVAEDCTCSSCGAVYLLCTECFHPILAAGVGESVCPGGCTGGLMEARTGSYAPLANAARSGCVPSRPRADEVGTGRLWRLDDVVSRPVCRYGRVYVATARGTVRCLEEDTGKDVEWWDEAAALEGDPGALDTTSLHVSERHVYALQGQQITGFSLTDGDVQLRMTVALQQVHFVARDERLLVCGEAEDGSLRAELYDVGCEGEPRLVRACNAPGTGGGRRQPVSWPAVAGEGFLVLDSAGNLLTLSSSGEEDFRTVWANPVYSYVSAPSVVGGAAYVVAHGAPSGGAVIGIALGGAHVRTARLPGITPAYLGLRASNRALWLFDGERDLYELDLRAWSAPPRPIFLGIEMTGDMVLDTLVALEQRRGRGAWLVSLAGAPRDLTARMVHSVTQQRPTLDVPPGPLGLAASDRHLLIVNLETGDVLVYDIPRA